ncbi:MAG: hypothetical protein L0H70_05545, partial [Xanthomonadales bacterium]|nr:hypothetical protein [Xanthomonadales bacterium]
TDARSMPKAFFLAWRDGHFVDVTQAVRSGQRHVAFKCVRRAVQCACPGPACPHGLPLTQQ